MSLTIERAQKLSDAQLRALSPAKRKALEHEVADWIRRDAQVNQLVYYRVVNPDAMRLMMPSPSMSESISAPRATP